MHEESQEPSVGMIEKLDRLVAYTWDESRQFRSSYGVWCAANPQSSYEKERVLYAKSLLGTFLVPSTLTVPSLQIMRRPLAPEVPLAAI
jgi:hypothetical protein